MMKLSMGVVAIGILTTTACVPMEQASLTYVSKTTMGVSVAAGTQETPGLDVAIGFKETNFALVPIAVAKYCYKASGQQCQNLIYQMEKIVGSKGDAFESLAVQKQLSTIKVNLDTLFRKQQSDTKNLAELKGQISLFEGAAAADAELAKLGPAVLGESQDVANARDEAAAKAKLRPASFDINTARAAVVQLEADQVRDASLVKSLNQTQSDLSGKLNPNSNRIRTDAYSVYGKFNGEASGNSQGAGLTVGKVFATGIAAQNLTEFATTADCLASIGFLAKMIKDDRTAQNTLLSSAGNVCKQSN